MQFSTTSVATLAFIIPLITASPTPTQLFKRDDECGVSEFHGETSGGSPFWLDCLMINNNIAGGGTWNLAANEEKDLASWGSCKFRVKVHDNLGARVGNEDIRDVIKDAINQFKHDNRVGAWGRMECWQLVTNGKAAVNWWIQHT